MLSIFQHFHAIPLRSPLSPSGSSPDGEPRGFGAFLYFTSIFINSHYTKQRGALSQLYLSSYTRLETFRECLHLKTEVPVCRSAQCIGFSIGHELYQNQNNVVIRLTQ